MNSHQTYALQKITAILDKHNLTYTTFTHPINGGGLYDDCCHLKLSNGDKLSIVTHPMVSMDCVCETAIFIQDKTLDHDTVRRHPKPRDFEQYINELI